MVVSQCLSMIVKHPGPQQGKSPEWNSNHHVRQLVILMILVILATKTNFVRLILDLSRISTSDCKVILSHTLHGDSGAGLVSSVG